MPFQSLGFLDLEQDFLNFIFKYTQNQSLD